MEKFFKKQAIPYRVGTVKRISKLDIRGRFFYLGTESKPFICCMPDILRKSS
jgi:hypothetical protein